MILYFYIKFSLSLSSLFSIFVKSLSIFILFLTITDFYSLPLPLDGESFEGSEMDILHDFPPLFLSRSIEIERERKIFFLKKIMQIHKTSLSNVNCHIGCNVLKKSIIVQSMNIAYFLKIRK